MKIKIKNLAFLEKYNDLENSLRAEGFHKDRLKNTLKKCSKIQIQLSELYEILDAMIGYHNDQLTKSIIAFDHFGFIVPGNLLIDDVNGVANNEGFNNQIQILDSKVLSKRLGELSGKEEVPTRIFKARTASGRGIETFLPKASPVLIDTWIDDSVGFHMAFKMNSTESVYNLGEIFNQAGIFLMDFMNGKPMHNASEGSIISYFEIALDDRKICLEFCHY
jgi:hypothetical protein